MAPLIHALNDSKAFTVTVCVTAQHRQMLDSVLKLFMITPEFDMNLMGQGQDLCDITSRVLLGMRSVLSEVSPDLVVVHGDTTSALAAAMGAFYANIPVAHVEAGLRTHNLRSPFPEEFNRQVISKLASLHFAPTVGSRENLIREGVEHRYVYVTGNTVIDALQWITNRIQRDPAFAAQIKRGLDEVLRFNWEDSKFILITAHRRENFGLGFVGICEAIRSLSGRYPSVHFIYPVHMNPNVQDPVLKHLSDLPNVHLIPPLDYEAFAYLLELSHIVLTDSGGLQEEAPSLGKPVLVMRETTERPEALAAGTVRLVGTDSATIIENVVELLDNQVSYTGMARAINPYGDGHASSRILQAFRAFSARHHLTDLSH